MAILGYFIATRQDSSNVLVVIAGVEMGEEGVLLHFGGGKLMTGKFVKHLFAILSLYYNSR